VGDVVLDAVSVCSVAPSLHELDAELAQYSDLLNEPTDSVNDNTATLPGDCDESSTDRLRLETVHELSELLPGESAELDQFALRPTAASLGLNDAIKQCLGDDEPDQTGYSTHNILSLLHLNFAISLCRKFAAFYFGGVSA